jgi:WD40 repeat protein
MDLASLPLLRRNAVRRQLHALAHHLGGFQRAPATPEPIRGHPANVYLLVFSPDSVFSSFDKAIKDTAVKNCAPAIAASVSLTALSHAQSCTLKNHNSPVTNLRASALGPGGAPIVAKLRNGDTLQFMASERDQRGQIWAKVTLARTGAAGWLLSKNLDCAPTAGAASSPAPTTPPPAPEAAPPTLASPTPKPMQAPGATAAISKAVELKCLMIGQCSGVRLGINSNDHSCPRGLDVLNGNYRITLNANDKTVILSDPDLEQTILTMSCADGKCEATGAGIDKNTRWTHSLVLTNSNTHADYTYTIVSDFGDGMRFAVTHDYHGSCTP